MSHAMGKRDKGSDASGAQRSDGCVRPENRDKPVENSVASVPIKPVENSVACIRASGSGLEEQISLPSADGDMAHRGENRASTSTLPPADYGKRMEILETSISKMHDVLNKLFAEPGNSDVDETHSFVGADGASVTPDNPDPLITEGDDSLDGGDSQGGVQGQGPPAKMPRTGYVAVAHERKLVPLDTPDLDPDICEFISIIARKRIGNEAERLLAEKAKLYEAPANCPVLRPPKVNGEVWAKLTSVTRNNDAAWQNIQQQLLCGITAVARLAEILDKDKAPEVALISDALQFLCKTNVDICLKRREMIKPNINEEFRPLFSKEAPVTDLLFGDNLASQVQDIAIANKLQSKLTRTQPKLLRGNRRPFFNKASAHWREAAQAWRGQAPKKKLEGGSRSPTGGPLPESQGCSIRQSVQHKQTVETEVSAAIQPITDFQYGGRLKHYLHNWKKYTTDQTILETVSSCYIEFDNAPVQAYAARELKFNETEKIAMNNEIQALLRGGVIEKSVHEPGEYVGHVFSRPKKDGSLRVILNLKPLNEFVTYQKFKMDTRHAAERMLTPGAYMASIDLKQAYYLVPIAPEHKKFLKFFWDGNLFAFTCLPNGLSCAPRIFTKLLKPVYSTLQMEGISCLGYIDDSLFVATSQDACQRAIDRGLQLFTELGFIINTEKSVLVPTQHMTFLGFEFNSVHMTIQLGLDKQRNMLTMGNKLLSKPTPLIREVAQLVGLMVSYSDGTTFGPLHFRQLEHDKKLALKRVFGNFDSTMTLSVQGKQDIAWWLENVQSESRTLWTAPPSMVVFSDASKEGWGGECWAHLLPGADGRHWKN